jgi:glycosyltransferase involved in cell wall biosynthesis
MAKVALVAHWDWVLYNFRLPIAKRLRQFGHEVVLICPTGRFSRQLEDAGFRFLPWSVDRRSFRPLTERRSISHLSSIYLRERFDIAHHFTIKPNLYGTIAARRAAVPVVINTFSGMGFLLAEGRVAMTLRLLVGPIMRARFHSSAVWTVFQNDADLAATVARGWVPAERSCVIAGSGVDTEAYSPAVERPAGRVPVFVMAARLIKEKGVFDYLAAARSLLQAGEKARFLVAGEPDPGNPSSLTEDQVDQLKQDGSVEFLGHVSDMPGLLRDADVAVLPTYYPEGLPRFLLEAAACGLPLIATDIPPCRPIVKEGHNGYLVRPRDPDALVAAIVRLAKDEGLRREMGSNSRRLVVNRFREDHVVDQYVSLYERLLSRTT